MKDSHSKLLRRIAAPIISASMVFSFMVAPAFAYADEVPNVPVWAQDDGQNSSALSAQAELPKTYDLRDDGLVTPVKLQNPFQSCWAFGAIAATESSLLSTYGSTYKDSKLDLSERHLAYFALHPVTAKINPNQAGEGVSTFDTSPNAALDAGGAPIYVTSLFSQGVGPISEEVFPYRGKDGMLTLDYINAHPAEAVMTQLIRELGSEEAAEEFIARKMAEYPEKTREEVIDEVANFLRVNATETPTYSDHDDWSIPEENEDGHPNRLLSGGVVLKDGNVLPEYWADAGKTQLNPECSTDIKQELLNGHGVSVIYAADQSGKYTNTNEKGTSFAQYTFENAKINHSVCIVGYDDNYAAENFTHKIKGADGQVDPDSAQKTTPPDKGAWIVKNSWGSQTDGDRVDDLGNAVNKGTFGIKDESGKATGYFYISYYDKTLTSIETMSFTANLMSSGFYTIQHDYMPAVAGFFKTAPTDDVTSSANVFTVEEPVELKSVSTRTSEKNMRVTFAVYLLNDNAKDPTDGELLYRTSENFQLGGFHRLDLDRKVTFRKGQRFSIVSTASTVDNSGKRMYTASANQGVDKNLAKTHGLKVYSTAVINEGESFLYSNSKWEDWKGYVDKQTTTINGETKKYTDVYPVDNFSIKAYAVPISYEDADKPMHRLYNPNSGEHFYTANDSERDMLVDLGWKFEGEGWTAPAMSDTPVYRLYNANGGEHHYTMDASEKDALIAAGWNDEGIGWYSDDGKEVPLYREYNPNAFANNHNYTTDEAEHKNLISLGWRDEGYAWYGLATN